MNDLVERLRNFEGSDELGNGDFSLMIEAADALEAAGEDAEHFRWLGQCPNVYTVADLLRAGEYVTLRRACESLRPIDAAREARNG